MNHEITTIKWNLFTAPMTQSLRFQNNLIAFQDFFKALCKSIIEFRRSLQEEFKNFQKDPGAWLSLNSPQKKHSLSAIWMTSQRSGFLNVDQQEFEYLTRTKTENFEPFTLVLIPEGRSFLLRVLVERENDVMDFHDFKVNQNIDFSGLLQEIENMVKTNNFPTNDDFFVRNEEIDTDYSFIMSYDSDPFSNI
jgi:hypothetical protein